MIRFLFWNINGKSLDSVIADLAVSHDIDVLLLAECALPPHKMLQTLNRGGDLGFRSTFSECERVAIYTRFSDDFIVPRSESGGFTIRRLRLPARTEILLAAVHLPSKSHWRNASQNAECIELGRHIREEEERAGHRRTVLVGDLNMDPFQEGVVAAPGLGAVMTRQLADREVRTVQGREYPFFYNPMWGLFGDATPGPPGTYYYGSGEHLIYFWNMFDQVLIRPELMASFRNESLRILCENGGTSFLDRRGLPDASRASDHLPIMFELDL